MTASQKPDRHPGGSAHVWVVDAGEADFDAIVVAGSAAVPVLVDIGADWCAPCRVLTPALERLAADYAGRFLLVRIDADENMRIAGRHKVRGFPTVIAYSHGREIDRFQSAQPVGFLRRFIDRTIEQHRQADAAAYTETHTEQGAS